MDEIHCPNCDRLLPGNSQYCIECGEVFASSDANPRDMRAGQEVSASPGGRKLTRPLTEQNMRAGQEVSASSAGRKLTRPLTEQNVQRHTQSGRINSSLLDEDYEDYAPDFNIEEEITSVAEPRHETWQKVVETPGRPPIVYPPRPPLPPQSRSMLRHIPYGRSHISPVLLFWCSMIVIFFFVGGGVFGIVGTLGKGRVASAAGATLQVTPDDVAVGATMNLRGSGFSPHSQVGFTRDTAIPILDTNGMAIITSDGEGNFTDTVIVGPDWVNGAHTINAEDAVTHKSISSPIQVTGMGGVLRPAHLGLSATSLDLGAGDQATNSVQKVALTNLGGGEISWQAAATRPWLTISPKSGTFSSSMKVEVEIAVNRSNLQPGTFDDQVLFSSSAGDTVLPIKMSVTTLQPQGEAVLQVAPASLSFAGNDGGSAPDDQAVTISNPGQVPLHWTAQTTVPWLTISSQTGTVGAASSESTEVHVNTGNLLPGTYSGNVTFNGAGTNTAVHSPQSIVVSVTIMPGCALVVGQNQLTFTAGYNQPAPGTKGIDLSTSHCSSSTTWHATSNASWLTVSQTSGSTPAKPAIGINVAGLKPGTYTGSVTFSSDSGKQQVLVKFIMSQPAQTVLSVDSTDGLNFYAVAGQRNTTTKNIRLANTGGGTLFWHATATTGNGGDWLAVSPGSGEISAHQSTTLSVTAKARARMAPATYSGTISITGTDEQGNTVTGSPQSIPISEVVNANCMLAASPAIVTFTGTTGQFARHNQAITLTASNGCSNTLNWTAKATSNNGGGNWLTTTSSSGSISANEAGTIGVRVSLAGLTTGNYSGTITITTVDSVTNAIIGGNSITIPVTINITSPQVTPSPQATALPTATPSPIATSAMEVSNTTLAFSTTAGSNPGVQTFTITNTGRDTLSWEATTPSQPWLLVSPGRGSNTAGTSSTLTVSANATGLAPKEYAAIIELIPSSGPSITVKVSLRISAAPPTPVARPAPTIIVKPAPTPTATPTLEATQTSLSSPSPADTTKVPVPTSSPTKKAIPTQTTQTSPIPLNHIGVTPSPVPPSPVAPTPESDTQATPTQEASTPTPEPDQPSKHHKNASPS